MTERRNYIKEFWAAKAIAETVTNQVVLISVLDKVPNQPGYKERAEAVFRVLAESLADGPAMMGRDGYFVCPNNGAGVDRSKDPHIEAIGLYKTREEAMAKAEEQEVSCSVWHFNGSKFAMVLSAVNGGMH
jgi:hypothetical protein